MTEILVITRLEFEEARERIDIECPDFIKLRERLNNIVNTHPCFLEPITVPNSNEVVYNYHQNNFSGSKKKLFNKRSANNQNLSLNHYHINVNTRKKVDDPKREVKSFLNKLTNNNFELIKSKLLRLCFSRNDNSEVIQELLTCLFIHPSYRQLYINLLIDFNTRYADLTKSSIQLFVNNTIEDIIHTLRSIEEVPLVSEYDSYCKYVKMKDRFTSKYHCAILLDKVFLGSASQEAIISTLCQYVPFITNHSAVFITHMLLIFRTEYIVDMIHLSILKDIYNHISQIINLPRKVHFQWEEILTMN